MHGIKMEADDERGLNRFKHKVDCYGHCFNLVLSINALHFTNHGLKLLKRNDIWTGNTGATMHCTFCGLHDINTRATKISTTCMSGGSIKPLLQMELGGISVDQNSNAAGLVQLGNIALLESSKHNFFSLPELLNIG